MRKHWISASNDTVAQRIHHAVHNHGIHIQGPVASVKVHSDYENSIQDDFTDLKQDLKNHISEKQKTSVNTFQKDMKNLENSMESSDDKFDGLKNEIVSLQRELKDLKESKNKNYELEEELKDIKNLLKTLLDQKSGQEKTENKEKITE